MPENTSAGDYRDINAYGVLALGASDYITGQEAAGQRQLIGSTALPVDTRGDGDGPFLALGFTFGEHDARDPLFRPATLPDGWAKVGSDHAMWSYVVDELGRRRVAVFYKAAFYDRDAFMRVDSVSSYVRSLEYDDKPPVYDDTWCTREAVAEVVVEMRGELEERRALYADRLDTISYAAGELAKVAENLVKLEAWAKRAGLAS